MKKAKKKGELFDINKLPAKEGILFFGVSIGNIDKAQSAKKCFEYIDKNLIKKIQKPIVGANFVYGDNLYLYSNEKSSKLKNKHQILVERHKNSMLNMLNKNKWYIQKSFSFITWNQMLLECRNFNVYFDKIKKLYKEDKEFKKYVKEDIKNSGRKFNQNNAMFIVEESLIFYLVIKGKVRLFNEYVQDKQKWILNCYPGKPLYTEIYISQKNPLNLSNPKNKYEDSFYDLEERKLYNFKEIDLESIKLK